MAREGKRTCSNHRALLCYKAGIRSGQSEESMSFGEERCGWQVQNNFGEWERRAGDETRHIKVCESFDKNGLNGERRAITE